MVDFSNDTLMSKPPADVVALILLEKYANFLEAVELWIIQENKNYNHNTFLSVKARLFVLFWAQKEAFRRALPEKEFNLLEALPDTETFTEVVTAYNIIIKWLDATRILKLDTIKIRDTEDLSASNIAMGFD